MSGLAFYIKDLAKAKILIFHKLLGNDGEAALVFFKGLSMALDGYSLTTTAEKVILVEKRTAMYVFGYFPGKQCSRAAYFLAYTVYALACNVNSVDLLEAYGKHYLLRFREPDLDPAVPHISEYTGLAEGSREQTSSATVGGERMAEEEETQTREAIDTTATLKRKRSPIKFKKRMM